jgi:predicted nucleic acid-binding protein
MINKLLVDTNIIIHLLNGNTKVKPFLKNKELCISFITEMELLSKRMITKSEITLIETLIEECTVFEMNDRIKSLAIIYMRNNRLKLPDAIISATCKYYNLEFITADAVFEKIPQAQIIKL